MRTASPVTDSRSASDGLGKNAEQRSSARHVHRDLDGPQHVRAIGRIRRGRQRTFGESDSKTRIWRSKEQRESPPCTWNELKSIAIDKLLLVDLGIDDEVNYSLLHNNRQLLRKLTLTKLVEGPLEDIAVQVELVRRRPELSISTHDRGAQTRCKLRLAPQVKNSADRKPSTRAARTRAIDRLCEGHLRRYGRRSRTPGVLPSFQSTSGSTILDNNPWLPSFVLPRDPAILKIINARRDDT